MVDGKQSVAKRDALRYTQGQYAKSVPRMQRTVCAVLCAASCPAADTAQAGDSVPASVWQMPAAGPAGVLPVSCEIGARVRRFSLLHGSTCCIAVLPDDPSAPPVLAPIAAPGRVGSADPVKIARLYVNVTHCTAQLPYRYIGSTPVALATILRHPCDRCRRPYAQIICRRSEPRPCPVPSLSQRIQTHCR